MNARQLRSLSEIQMRAAAMLITIGFGLFIYGNRLNQHARRAAALEWADEVIAHSDHDHQPERTIDPTESHETP